MEVNISPYIRSNSLSSSLNNHITPPYSHYPPGTTSRVPPR
jgi:hypothetical protein